MGDEVAEGFGEQLVRRGEVFLAVPEQHTGALVERRPGPPPPAMSSCRARPRRVTRSTSRPPPAATRLNALRTTVSSVLASDDTDRRPHRQACRQRHDRPDVVDAERLPEHLDGLDRIGQPLQGERAERPAVVAAAAPGRQPDDVGRQHLPVHTPVAQPRRLDDRLTEVVVVLVAHLAGAQTDPQPDSELTSAALSFDALLHRHGARQRRRRRSEHDHQPVAEGLHLGAAGFDHRLAQHREVPTTEFVRCVRGQARRQCRRPDHVGEQHRHVLGRHHALPRYAPRQ